MSERCDRVRDLAPGFVLGALTPDEDREVREHLASCPEPHEEFAELGGVTDHEDAVALAYCTDHPVRSTGAVPLLKISMKSFRNGAPEFPPPPKI